MIHWLLFQSVVIYAIYRFKPWNMGKREKDLPPGPPTTFLIGNAAQYPKIFPYFKFVEWAQTYGDVFSLKIMNQTLVVINSAPAIKDILDRQGVLTGNRPEFHMLVRADGPTMPNQNMDTHIWRSGRKAARNFLTADGLKAHWPTQQAEFAQFLKDILDKPEDLYTHLKRTMVSTISTLVYGKRLTAYKGTEAETYFKGVKLLNEVMDPTAHPPIDLFPLLKYVPARFASWKGLCARAKAMRGALYNGLFSEVEQKIASGTDTGSYIGSVLNNLEDLDMNREEAMALAKVFMDAGAETSTSFIQSFVLAMINFPECQRRAQQEIDEVIGEGRLPAFEDFPTLPYVNAFIKEIHRYRPVVPLGLPHSTAQDVKYKDYIIPAGATILTNLWAVYHDPNLFDEPEMFKPERYLKSEFGTRTDIKVNTDGFRDNLPFGSGRRICPGAEMASKTIAINAMNLLWAFDFSKDNSGSGGMEIDAYQKPGVELAALPFSCRVVPRSARRAELVREWHSQASALA